MNTSEEKTFTLEELSKFNGKNGAKAYVAVDGVVYDVTDSPKWKEGEHQGAVKAGADLTKEIKEMSPHGVKALEKLPVVGKLVK
ncbi:MAG: cytochrome b5 domain-containing protein [Tissierellia bacterium]|nr:cytochrome b5 domain-containing protein [Tissierellia bacterium]